jgi:hypothetical protein
VVVVPTVRVIVPFVPRTSETGLPFAPPPLRYGEAARS